MNSMILSFVCFNTCRNYNLCNNQLWSETDFYFSEKAEEGQIACLQHKQKPLDYHLLVVSF